MKLNSPGRPGDQGTAIAESSDMTLTVIGGSANVPLVASIAHELGVEACGRALQRFADGELHVEVEQSVRGHDVYVIEPTSHPVDEHVMELLFLADACRRAGAARLTAVVPYFGYARQDRRASGREAVGAGVIASLIETAGFSRIVALDLHAPEIEGFFRIPLEHLSATRLLAEAVRSTSDAVIVAPDLGAVKLAERYQGLLHVPVVILHKTRVTGSDVSLRSIIGDVKDRAPIVVDDMITTGGTIEAAVKGLLDAGCKPNVSVLATHAVFVGRAAERLMPLPIQQLISTNSVESEALPTHLQVVNVAPMIAETIGRLNRDQSLEPLLARA
jgi:ribose-phosphate pyrophosphokinase